MWLLILRSSLAQPKGQLGVVVPLHLFVAKSAGGLESIAKRVLGIRQLLVAAS
jgi:hypothetical protein